MIDQTPWSNAVDIPQTHMNLVDVWDNAFNIPPLNQATPPDDWNHPGWDNAFNISSPNQATPPGNWNHPGWNNAFSIPIPNQAYPPITGINPLNQATSHDNYNRTDGDNAAGICQDHGR